MQAKSRSRTTTEGQVPFRSRTDPIHPGEMLREEFLLPLGLTGNALAIAIGVPATRIGEILHERRGISGDTALRLGEYFRTGPEFWMNLQARHELELARDARETSGARAIEPAPVDGRGALLRRSA